MIYTAKQGEFYQNKVNSSLVSTCNCKWAIFFLEPAEPYHIWKMREIYQPFNGILPCKPLINFVSRCSNLAFILE